MGDLYQSTSVDGLKDGRRRASRPRRLRDFWLACQVLFSTRASQPSLAFPFFCCVLCAGQKRKKRKMFFFCWTRGWDILSPAGHLGNVIRTIYKPKLWVRSISNLERLLFLSFPTWWVLAMFLALNHRRHQQWRVTCVFINNEKTPDWRVGGTNIGGVQKS